MSTKPNKGRVTLGLYAGQEMSSKQRNQGERALINVSKGRNQGSCKTRIIGATKPNKGLVTLGLYAGQEMSSRGVIRGREPK